MKNIPLPILGIVVALLLSLLTQGASSAQPQLVKNIYAGTAQSGIGAEWKVTAGNRVFMTAQDETHGRELWVSDGTEAGTHLVKDITPGISGSSIEQLVASGDRVFFTVHDAVTGRANLWVSDGTVAGTRMVFDFSGGSNEQGVVGVRPFKKGVLFVADSVTSPTALWFTEGQGKAPTRVMTLNSRSYAESANIPTPVSWQEVNGLFYFFLVEPNGEGAMLWVTDGSPAGTRKLKYFPGVQEGRGELWILGSAGKTMYFSGWGSNERLHLWKTEGTAASTVPVKEMTPFYSDESPENALIDIDGRAYLLVEDPDVGGVSLWSSDGSVQGTRMEKDLSSLEGNLYGLQMVKRQGNLDILLSIQVNNLGQSTLITFDPATRLWQNVYEAPGYLVDGRGVGSQTYFVRQSDGGGFELGKTDGTEEGTVSIREFPGWYGATPEQWMKNAGELLLFNNDAFQQTGVQLWRTDGTAEGTREIVSTQQAPGNSSPSYLRTIGGHIYFAASDAEHGHELWRTDGTEAGTVLVADVCPGAGSASPRDFVEMNGKVYFTADDGTVGRELWVTDGTSGGTHLVKDLIAGTYSSDPGELTVFNDHVYFRANVSTSHGFEVWRSDGTESGTVVYANLSPNATVYYASSPRNFTVVDGWLYFTAYSEALAGQSGLFRTNGSSGVTQVGNMTGVTDVVVRPPFPGAVVQPGASVIYFVTATTTPTRSSSLYRCTVAESPVLVLSRPDSNQQSLEISGQHVVWFSSSHTGVIAASDGTSVGTRMLGTSGGLYCGTAGGRIYYVDGMYAPQQSIELRSVLAYGTDDTLAFKHQGHANFVPVHSVGRTLFFKLSTNGESTRLMRTSGNEESTWPIEGLGESLANGWLGWSAADVMPANMQTLGDRLYFGAPGPEGVELYSLPIEPELELAVKQQWGKARVLAPGEVLDFGSEGVGVPRQATLRFRNVGLVDMPGLSVFTSEETPADFAISPSGGGNIEAGHSVTRDILFTPAEVGARTGSVEIMGVEISREIPVTGKGLGPNAAPVIGGPAGDGRGYYLVLEGESLTLPTPAVGTPWGMAAYVWMKDGKQVSDQQVIDLPEVKLKDGGTYVLYAVNQKGHAQSKPAYVAVAGYMEEEVITRGKKVTLTCRASGPSSLLSFQWLRDGIRLADQGRIQGTQTAKLTLDDLRADDAAAYECLVTLQTPEGPITVSHGQTQLTIEERPVVTPPEEGSGLTNYVGELVEYQLDLSLEGRLSIRGLPPGLRMNASGLITGQPTRSLPVDPVTGQPAPYIVTVTLRDPATKLTSEPVSFPWTILEPVYAGTYQGNVDRAETEESSPEQMGGSLKFTVTNKRSLSGQLRYGGKNYRFKGRPNEEEDPEFVVIELKRAGKEPLWLTFAYDESLNSYLASVQDLDVDFYTETIARPRAFTPLSPALDFEGNHHIVIEPDSSDSAQHSPMGMSFFTMRVSASGEAVWAGRMADDTPITGSSLIVKNNDDSVPMMEIHAEIYKEGGSVHGFMQGSEWRNESLIDWSGVMSWSKHPLRNPGRSRLYPHGFDAAGLPVTGSKYLPPVDGKLVLGIDAGSENNVSFYFTEDFLDGVASEQTFTLSAGHQVTLPPFNAETPLRSLTIDPIKGTFQGTVEITNENPGDPENPFIRTSKFQGVLLPTYQVGQAYCILPELPDEEGETLENTPLRSCLIGIWGDLR